MSYPPPSGPRSSTPQAHPSLPARPPQPAFKPAFSSAGSNGASRGPSASSAFTPFRPRTVASSSNQSWSTPSISAAPAPPSSFQSQAAAYPSASYQQQSQQAYQYPGQQGQQQYYPQGDAYGQSSAAPMIHNPFAPSVVGGPAYDPEHEAQIAQWQAAYAAPSDQSKDKTNTTSTTATTTASASAAPATEKTKTVVRSGGGETWNDPTLLEWDPAHFRLFVGNLAGEVTDDSLLKAFSKYPSVQKARVIRDKRTTKSKGYGFVSFSDGDNFFLAAKEMQGKYIGSHPVLLRRANTDVRATVQKDDRKGKGKGGKGGGGHGGGGGGAAGGANTGAGIQKKQSKTKGGLKLLG